MTSDLEEVYEVEFLRRDIMKYIIVSLFFVWRFHTIDKLKIGILYLKNTGKLVDLFIYL